MDIKKFIAELDEAVANVEKIYQSARKNIKRLLDENGSASERHQHQTHGLAWYGTYVEALRQSHQLAIKLDGDNQLGELEHRLISLLFGEYLAQILGGIAMSQTEFIRPAELGLGAQDLAPLQQGACARLIARADSDAKAHLIDLIIKNGAETLGHTGLDDVLETMRTEMRRFSEKEVTPHVQNWHLNNDYVPMDIVKKLAELGIFALTLPEEYGGLALSKQAMCVVSEELSRSYLSLGSLVTRTEIASELLTIAGTDVQKKKYLPDIASGTCLPTAVFTEPETGSNLAALRTRAKKQGGNYLITGNKTWITHPVRADLMLLLARTGDTKSGIDGLSMFLAEKPRGSDDNPFPADGMSGSEIEVIGYRGMKEYDIAFDQFKTPQASLLGGKEGEGFRQLMQTFESARIQTASRAVGVAQSAFDHGLSYARNREQFGKNIIAFPRIANKLALMAAEIFVARQLTYFAALAKDQGRRCDLEAGMAKLLAARIAWSAADNALQIHGGHGYAAQAPISRILCDARILSIFEGTSEIQAQVIARRLLSDKN